MRVIYFPKFNFIIFFISLSLSTLAYAGQEEDDVINKLWAQSLEIDMENQTKSTTDFLVSEQSKDNADIDAQLKDIERDYLAKIDAHAATQNHDELASSLASKNEKNPNPVAEHVKDFAAKDPNHRVMAQQEVGLFLEGTAPSGGDLSELIPSADSTKVDDSGFVAEDFGDAVSKL